jgi:hypothetical protein
MVLPLRVPRQSPSVSVCVCAVATVILQRTQWHVVNMQSDGTWAQPPYNVDCVLNILEEDGFMH